MYSDTTGHDSLATMSSSSSAPRRFAATCAATSARFSDAGAWEDRFWQYYEAERAPGPVDRLTFERIMETDLDALGPQVRAFVDDRLLR